MKLGIIKNGTDLQRAVLAQLPRDAQKIAAACWPKLTLAELAKMAALGAGARS